MMYASCKNCCHSQLGACELGLKPDDKELFCKKYSMTVGFREEILRLMREDVQKEISRATVMIRMRKAEEAQAFAG